ncbi:NAD(P)/FAD-dependent oxidoreductase [Nocardioides caldifontis]|uniref:NAD(P)/FAD-dependent oxidoreductase n=1 Tax=Nocardioides caldifontis TaxID=2588938 RepID=UPI0011DF7214|nr:FAD-dependent oxidoreductase [Nocardioides caldifontis]
MTAQTPSLWDTGVEQWTKVRPALGSDISCDVLVVGAGYTGLWTAYYLSELAPHLDIVVAEAERVGYGASGRNGGWLSYLVPGNRQVYEKGPRGHEGLVRLQRQMVDAVDEVLDVADRSGLAIDARKGGNLVVAPNEAGMARLRLRYAADLRAGMATDEVRMLTAAEVAERVDVAGAVGGLYAEACARIHPGKLVRQLADLVESRGVRIFERTRITDVEEGVARSHHLRVQAGSTLICTEGFSGPLLGRRNVIPIRSTMIATQQLGDADWERIGWQEAECLSDTSHTFIYAQRTADGRIAVGGRGKPYEFGSRIDERQGCHPQVEQALLDRLTQYFPGVRFRADHAWSGVLGVSRDWCASVRYDRASSVGSSVGYAGHGVAAANLAARTLVDLVLGRDTERVALPLVDHRPPRWEPEPIRWVGVQTMYRLFRTADAREEKRGATSTSLIARAAGKLAGLSP